MSGIQKSLDVQAIKTRQIVVQDPSGSFPDLHSVLTVKDGRGHTEWTTDIVLDSLTATNVVVNDTLQAENIVATNIATMNLAATNIAVTNASINHLVATEIDANDLYAEAIKGVTGTFDVVNTGSLVLGITGSTGTVTYEGGNTLYVNGEPIQAIIGLTGTYFSDYIYWNTKVSPSQWSVKSTNYIHLGVRAGENSTPIHSVAIGQEAGITGQSDYSIAMGSYAGNLSQGSNSVAMGHLAGNQYQGTQSVAIGYGAGSSNQTGSSVAIGYYAGLDTQGGQCVAIGQGAGQENQSPFAVSVGFEAGNVSQGSNAVAIGWMAGYDSQGKDTIAIGYNAGFGVNMQQYDNAIAVGSWAGYNGQNGDAIAIGYNAGYGAASQQGANAIAIGSCAGYTSQATNTIILNASGSDLSTSQAGSLYINPIRNVDNSGLSGILRYNSSTSEIVYDTTTNSVGSAYTGIATIDNTLGTNPVNVPVTGVSITATPIIQLTFFNDGLPGCQNPVNPADGNRVVSCWYNWVSASSFQIEVSVTPVIGQYFKIAWTIVKP